MAPEGIGPEEIGPEEIGPEEIRPVGGPSGGGGGVLGGRYPARTGATCGMGWLTARWEPAPDRRCSGGRYSRYSRCG